MIDPRVLRTFLAVCRERSITGAARHLNISQPSVSVAIAQLEQRLGGSLFQRGRQGFALNAMGEALMRRAEMMEALLLDAEEAVALAKRGVQGPLRIGGTPGALVSLVPDAVARMEDGTRMALQLIERTDAQLTDLLRRGNIEVAVVATGIDQPPEDIEERSIACDPFALIVGIAHAQLGATVPLGDTAEMGWVLPEAAGAFNRQVEALFLAAKMPIPADVIRCDSLLTSKAIVQRGPRVTLLPRGAVAGEVASGGLRAISISDAEAMRNIGIRLLVGRPLSELGARFVEAVMAT